MESEAQIRSVSAERAPTPEVGRRCLVREAQWRAPLPSQAGSSQRSVHWAGACLGRYEGAVSAPETRCACT